MGRKSIKEIRQLEIIKVYYKVAKKEGLENTSIAKIAKVMDINPSLIIHYFQSKEELTYALIDYTLDKYLQIYRVDRDNQSGLRTVLVKVVEDLFSKKWNKLFDDGLFYSCYALAYRDKEVKAMYQKLTDTLRDNLTRLLRRCQDERLIELSDARLTADLIFALVDGAYFYLSMSADQQSFGDRIAAYKTEAYRLLGIADPLVFAQGE